MIIAERPSFIPQNGKSMKITNSEDLGKAIRLRRKELGYTQTDISDYTGFSVSFISDLERGKPTAEMGKAIFLINLLGMDINIKSRQKK